MRRQPEREQLNRLTVNTLNQVLFMRPQGGWVASRSPGVAALQRNRSPGSTGSLLRGPLAVTMTRLPPASR